MNSVFGIFTRKQAVVYFRIRAISDLRKKNYLIKTIENMMTEKPEAESSNGGTALKFGRYPVHNNWLEVIGSGCHGGPRGVFLNANSVPYLFNCGEGAQRLCSEYRIKVNKVQHAFITYPSWKNIIGLFGVMLDLQSVGISDFHIYGHPSIASIFNETNRFVALRRITIHFEDIFDENEIAFDNVQIKKVFLYSSSSSSSIDTTNNESECELPSTAQEDTAKDQKLLEDYDDEGVDYYSHLPGNRKRCKIILKHKSEKRSRSEADALREKTIEKFALSYICKLKKTLGTLLIERCVELGVPPGQLLGELKRGLDITLSDGRVIKSSDVKSPDIPGDVVIFVECPSEAYLDSLLNEPKFVEHQINNNPEALASVVVHFSSCDIMENPKYKEWMSRFPRETKHVVINEENEWMGSIGVHRMQLKMNLIHPEVFPLLEESKIVFRKNESAKIKENIEVMRLSNSNQQEENCVHKMDEENGTGIGKIFYKWDGNSLIRGDSLCSVFLRPKKEYDYSKVFLIKEFFFDEVFQREGFSEELEKLKNVLKEMEPVATGNEYPKILFLGTGSSRPSKARNTSGILIFLDKDNSILFDCGEATYGQLVRFYGTDKAREILRNLKAVFISHLHPDHHLGLISVLIERKNLLMNVDKVKNASQNSTSTPLHQPLCILAPGQMLKWLKVVNRDLEKISNAYELIPNDKLSYSRKDSKLYEKLLKLLNLNVTTAFVRHVANSFGIAITHKDGWKLTYSGDTMPSENLIKIGQNSDVLIHEATMDDCLKEEAARKFHSTNAQAIEVGKKMNAKFTLLTHFSQRYTYSPVFNEFFNENVGVAYDNMLVSINQLKVLPKLTNVLKLVFLNHYEKVEERHTKHQRSTERKIEREKVKGSIGSG